MKKFTPLLALALLTGVSASAQSLGDRLSQRLESRPNFSFVQQHSTRADFMQSAFQRSNARKAAPKRVSLPLASTEAVMETPEGTEFKNQSLSSFWFYSFFGYLFNGNNSAAISSYVLTDDGTIWLYCPISQYNTGYLKLEKQDDGTYVAHTPQAILSENYGDEDVVYYATRLTLQDQGEGYFYYPEANDEGGYNLDMRFTYEDGVLRQVNDALDSEVGAPIEMIGLTDSEGTWYGYADGQIVVQPINETATTLPEGAQPIDYVMGDKVINTSDGTLSLRQQIVKMAEVGNDVYLAAPEQVDMWIKGSKTNDGSLTFESQYLGASESAGNHVWFKPGTFTIDYDETYEDQPYLMMYTLSDEPLTLTLQEDGSYAATEPSTLLVNAAKDKVYYVSARAVPQLKQFKEVAATPSTPTFTGYSPFDVDYGYGFFSFDLQPTDVSGNFLNTDKLSYVVFVDDTEPFVFMPDEYIALEEEMTELGYAFTDKYDIYVSDASHNIYFYFDNPDLIGLQAIYRGGGEEHRSEVRWLNVAEFLTGVKSATTATNGTPAACYDVQGRQLQQPQRGLNIVRMADGSVRKMIQK